MNWQFKLADLIDKECIKCPKGECVMNDIIALVQKEIDKGKKEAYNDGYMARALSKPKNKILKP